MLVTSGTVTSAELAEQRLPPRRHPPIRAARRAALRRALPRPLAARSRAVRRIRSVAEPDHGERRARHPADPGQRPAVGALVPALAQGAARRSRRCSSASTSASRSPPHDAERYAELGAPRVSITGNLKLDVPAPPADAAKLAAIQDAVGGRPIIAAASTHPGEESAVIDAHRRLRQSFPGLLTIWRRAIPSAAPASSTSRDAAGLPAAAALARRIAGLRHRDLHRRHDRRARPDLSARADRVHGRLAGAPRRAESDRGGQARRRDPARAARVEFRRHLFGARRRARRRGSRRCRPARGADRRLAERSRGCARPSRRRRCRPSTCWAARSIGRLPRSIPI